MKSKVVQNRLINNNFLHTISKNWVKSGLLLGTPKPRIVNTKKCLTTAYKYLFKINKIEDDRCVNVFPIIVRICRHVDLKPDDVKYICNDTINRLSRNIKHEIKQYNDVKDVDIEAEMTIYYSNELINNFINKNKQ